jgi:hypothetical protein
VRTASARDTTADEDGHPPTRSGDVARASVVLVLGVIFVFPLLVLVAYFATRTVLPGSSALQFAVPEGNSSSLAGVQPFNDTSPQQVAGRLFPPLSSQSLTNPLLVKLPGTTTIDLAVVLLIVTAVIVALIARTGLGTRRRRTTPFEDAGDLLADNRRKLAAILDTTVARLNAGSAYRETVIQCYGTISGLMEARSDVDGRVLTAREFEAQVSEKLRIESPYLADVTKLFELARYSDQEITMEQSREAVDCLSNLSASLKQPVPLVGGFR